MTRLFCATLGALMWLCSPRKKTIIDQVERAFPDRSSQWHLRIARLHCTRVFEMFLFILGLPHWPKKRFNRIQIDDSLIQAIRFANEQKRPLVFAIPHSTGMEGLTLIPQRIPECPPIITLYRALDYAPAEAYVKWARQRWGATLAARKEGLLLAKKQLASGHGVAAILFDQSTPSGGYLLSFFNRVCMATNLPGLLASKSNAVTVFLYARREAFWKTRLEGTVLDAQSAADITIATHRELERTLQNDDSACADWFWSHKRWKGLLRYYNIFSFANRKSYLSEQFGPSTTLPRNTRIALQLPALNPSINPNQLVSLIGKLRPDATIDLITPRTDTPIEQSETLVHIWNLDSDLRSNRALRETLANRHFDIYLNLDPNPLNQPSIKRFQAECRVGIVTEKPLKKVYHYTESVDIHAYQANPWPLWQRLLNSCGAPETELNQL